MGILGHSIGWLRRRPFWVVSALVLTGLLIGWGSAQSRTPLSASHSPPQPPPPRTNVIMGGSKFTGVPKGDPVKVALVADLTGKIGSFGPLVVKGARLMVELANKNGGVLGRPVELVLRDDGADPANTTRLTREIFQTERPDVLLGSILSSALLSQAPLVRQFKVPAFTTSASDVQWVGKQASLYTAMMIPSSRDDSCAMAKFIGAKHKAWKRIALLSAAFAYGDDYSSDFRKCLARFHPGAKVVVHKKFQIGEQNFLPFINPILGAKPDFIVGVIFGVDAVRLYQQYTGAGGKVPFSEVITDLEATRTIGKVPERFLYDGATRTRYTELGKTADPWVNAFRKRFRDVPSGDALQTIGAFLAYKAAAEKAGTTEPDKVMEAWRCLTYFDPRGWVKVRTLNGQADVPNFIGSFQASPKYKDLRLHPDDRLAVYAHDVWATDAELKKVMPKDAVRSPSQCRK